MTITPEQKDHAIELILMGDKLDAVRYLQETLSITVEEALLLAEKLEEENKSSLLKEFEALQEDAEKNPGVDVGRLVGRIFMSLGGIMLLMAAYFIYSNYQFSQRAVPVKGKVVDYKSYLSRNTDGRPPTTMYTPVFEYEFEGKPYSYLSSLSTSSKDYEINQVVEMLVDPEQPNEIMIDSFWSSWFVPVLLGAMGVMFTVMGYLAYRVFGRKKKEV